MTTRAKPAVRFSPAYWNDAKAELMKRDRVMKKLIPQCGDMQLTGRGDAFMTLARSIVGQQISVKAAETVWQRFMQACSKCTPDCVLATGLDGLSGCGLSKRKSEYIVDLAENFHNRRVQVHQWAQMDDEAVIAELTSIRGIGRWTADMFLIFNLLRPNVLPLDDLGLLKGISLCYFSGEPVSRSDAREVSANWEPWRTVGTWYLWRSLDPVPVEY